MAYIINKTTGEVLVTIPDGTADGPDINPGLNTTDLDLFGKNYPSFGEYQNENFIKLLQNFANTTAPQYPLQGELWYDLNTHFLKVYTGTTFVPVSPVTVSSSAPLTTIVGTQWWDSTNNQLNMWNGSTWSTVGPAWKATDGLSGAIVEDVYDTNGNSHTVIKFYTNANVSVIVSYDQAFTLSSSSAVSGFSVVNPGVTLSTESNNLIYGTAVNAQQLGNIAAVNYARNDIDSTFYKSINIGAGNLTITTNNAGSSDFTNTVSNGNISLNVNVGGTSTKALNINGSTGEITVSNSPFNNNAVTTKYYVDSSIGNAIAPLAPIYSPSFTGTPTAPNVASYTANTAQIATLNSVWGAISTSHNDTILQGNVRLYANAASTILALSVDGITGKVVVNADPTQNLGVATKQYVDTTVSTAIAPLAPINSASLTGTPTSTTPDYTDSSTRIATMNAVQGAISISTGALWLGSYKTVSTSTPTSGVGNPGDFWFQI